LSKFIIKTKPLSSSDLWVPFRVYLNSERFVSVTSIWIVLLLQLNDAPLAGVDQVKMMTGGVVFDALTVNVLGVASRSTPPFAVPPLSWTWKVKVVYGLPKALIGGTYFSSPLVIFATVIICPTVTLVPFSWIVHNAGKVVTFTPLSVFGDASRGSVNQKLAVVKVC